MLPSEQFELAIYRWVNDFGRSRPVNVPDFYNIPGSPGVYASVVERLEDLHAHGYIRLSKIASNCTIPFDRFVPVEGEDAFFGGGFVVEIAPGGRKFFESLEAREKQEKQSSSEVATMPVSTRSPTLAQLPSKPVLLGDIQQSLDARRLIALLFVNLDGFKSVNDTLGHDEGDKCLNQIVEILVEAIEGKGKLYRPGGDEFVVALPNFDRYEAAATAERIRAAIDTSNPGGTVKVTASIGVTDSKSSHAADSKALFVIADTAMYLAKEKKNRVVIDDGIDPMKPRIPKPVSTVYGRTGDLQVGERVQVLEPSPGVPREHWAIGSLVWVIREVNQAKKTAKATPVLPPMDGNPTPTVEGPMSGPDSPFVRTGTPS